MSAQRLLVVRHRQSEWNAQRRWTGQADPPLSDQGVAESKEIGDALLSHRFDAIVSSSSLRARQTAELVSARAAMPIAATDNRLSEHDVPRWTGLTREEIEELDPGVMNRWRSGAQFDLPGAEPWGAFERRVRDGLVAASGFGSRVLVIAHAGVLRAIRTSVGGADFKVPRRKGQWLSVDNGVLSLAGEERLHKLMSEPS